MSNSDRIEHETAPDSTIAHHHPRKIWLLSLYLIVALILLAGGITVYVNYELQTRHELLESLESYWNDLSEAKNEILTVSTTAHDLVITRVLDPESLVPTAEIDSTLALLDMVLVRLGTLSTRAGQFADGGGLLQAISRFVRSEYEFVDAARHLCSPHDTIDQEHLNEHNESLRLGHAGLLASYNVLTREQMKLRRQQSNAVLTHADSLRQFEAVAHLAVVALIIVIAIVSRKIALANARLEHEQECNLQKLRESEEHFRTLVRNIPGMGFRLRVAPDWPLVYISEDVEHFTGYPASDYIENRIRLGTSAFHPDDLEQAERGMLAAIKAKSSYQVEYRLVHKDGHSTWMHERGQVVCDENGNAAWIDGVVIDISEGKQTEASLRSTSARLLALLDAHPGPAMLIDRTGCIEAANRGLVDMLRRPAGQIIGRRAVNVLPKELAQKLEGAVEVALSQDESTDFVLEWKGRFTHIFVRPIREAEAGRVAMFGLDVTRLIEVERALRESEKLLRDTTAGIPGVVFQCRLENDGRLTFPMITTGLDGVFGITADECKANPELFFQRIHPEEAEVVMDSIWRAISERQPWLFEFRVSARDGVRWVRAQSTPMRQEDGRMVWNGVLFDVTEQRLLADELLESQERYRELIVNQEEGVCLVDTEGRFLVANPAAEKILGVPAGSLVNRNSSEFIEPTRLTELRRERDQGLKEGRSKFETWVTRPDGTRRTLSLSMAPRTDRHGLLIGYFIVARDTTELRSAQTALLESEERFRLLAEHATDIITMLTSDGRTLYVSPACRLILGWEPDEVTEQSLFDFTHPEDQASIQSRMSLLTNSHEIVTSISRLRHKQGHYVWLETLARAVFDPESGQLKHFIAVSRDVSERVRAEEERTRLVNILEATSDLVQTADREGRTLYLNRAGRHLLGYAEGDDFAGIRLEDMHPPDCLRRLRAEAIPAAVRDGLWVGESTVRRRDGSEFSVSHVMIAQLDAHGELICLSSIMRDLTERLKIESAISENLVQIHTLIAAAADGIITFDADGRIESVNPAAERIFATEWTQLERRSLPQLLAEPLRSTILAQITAPGSSERLAVSLIREGVAVRGEHVVFPIELAISRMALESGVKYVAFIRDISARKAAEQKIVENDARLNAILSSAAEGIIVTDATGAIQIFNAAARKIFALDPAEAPARTIQNYVRGLDGDSLREVHDHRSFEGVGRVADGREVPIHVAISRVQIGDDFAFALIIRDLTEEFERRQRLQEADRFTSIGTLAAGIAHEFKNYLAGIVGNASFAMDLIDEPEGLEEARQAFGQILAAGEKANEIAMSLLTYSSRRAESDGIVQLTEIVQATLRFVGKELIERRIELVTEFEEVPCIKASAGRLQQVVLNLVMNAAQAIDNGGTLKVRVANAGAWVQLQVSDTGIGIPEENLGRIFDPFFSTKGVWGRDSDYGTGLGLPLCRNVVSSYGGSISVESAPGKGSTFTILLPVMDAESSVASGPETISHYERLVIFSADFNTIRTYESESRERGIATIVAKTCEEIPVGANAYGVFCIADGRTPFKVELRRVFDRCRENGIPIALIDAELCGDCRHELQEAADLVVESTPGIDYLINHTRRKIISAVSPTSA